jgi:hypothetical protein
VNEDDVRRIVREEIVKAFRIFEVQAEPCAHSDAGDFERLVGSSLAQAADKSVRRIGVSRNGDRRECGVCLEWDDNHEEWCPSGA